MSSLVNFGPRKLSSSWVGLPRSSFTARIRCTRRMDAAATNVERSSLSAQERYGSVTETESTRSHGNRMSDGETRSSLSNELHTIRLRRTHGNRYAKLWPKGCSPKDPVRSVVTVSETYRGTMTTTLDHSIYGGYAVAIIDACTPEPCRPA